MSKNTKNAKLIEEAENAALRQVADGVQRSHNGLRKLEALDRGRRWVNVINTDAERYLGRCYFLRRWSHKGRHVLACGFMEWTANGWLSLSGEPWLGGVGRLDVWSV